MSLENLLPGVLASSITFGIIAIYVLTVIAWWKIFKKTGEPGWKSIIPLYNGHVLYGRCWKSRYFWIMTACSGVSGWLLKQPALQQSQMGIPVALLSLLTLVLGIVAAVLSIKFNFKLARAFGKGKGFGFGLWAFHIIFAFILAFGSAQYIGNPSLNANAAQKQ